MTSKTSDQTLVKADLASKANDLKSQQKLREAMATFRQLLSLERRPEWVQSLVACYDARGHELLHKGLQNEALVMWENCFEYPEGLTQNTGMAYLQCMIKAGKIGKAALFYTKHQELLEKHPDARRVETQFAARLLLGDSELLKTFALSTPLRQHAAIASQALTAYCAGDDVKMDAALKEIPFRSAFRDFSLLLKTLVILPQNPALARDMLKKIPSESAFFIMADRLAATTFEGDVLARHIAKAAPEYRALTAELKGWNKQQIQLAHDMGKIRDAISDSEKLNFLCAQKSAVPGPSEHNLRSAGKALLVNYPKGMKIFERRFGKMNVFEKSHIQALTAAKERDIKKIIERWIECFNNAREGNLSGVETSALLKHIAALLQQARGGGLRLKPDPDAMLKQAILRDSDDLSTYLDLMKLQAENDDKDYQAVLDAALKQFPDNRDILIQAITASQKKKAFKKAAGYAKKLLDLDPINRVARKSLVNCHLEHARKQILKKKTDLTLKEIALAQTYSQDAEDQMDIAAVSGWHEFLQDKKPEYLAAFDTVRKLAPHPLVADLVLFTEGLRQRVTQPKAMKAIGLLSAEAISGRELQTYCKRLRAYHQAAPKEVGTVMAASRTTLAKAAANLHEKNDFIVLCESLHAIRADTVLYGIADTALKKFPRHPLFVFYVIFANNCGNVRKLSMQQLQTLQDLANNDTMKSDQRAYVLINNFLHEYFDWLGPVNPFGWDDDEYDDDDDFDFDEYDGDPPFEALHDLVHQLKGSLPKKEADRLMKMLESADPEVHELLAEMLGEIMSLGGGASPKKKRW